MDFNTPGIHIVKVGSNTLIDASGVMRDAVVRDIIVTLKNAREQGIITLLITSGAVKLGRAKLNDPQAPTSVAASVGQPFLFHRYQAEADRHGLSVGEILLTRFYFTDREYFRNFQAILGDLLSRNILPIINENDALAADTDLSFYDNDALAALLALSLNAKRIIIMTHIDGLFSEDPSKNQNASLISDVTDVSKTFLKFISKKTSEGGRGGMLSKVKAARLCSAIGIGVHIINGLVQGTLSRALSQHTVGTFIHPRPFSRQLKNRERWMLAAKNSSGSIEIDRGAEDALKKGKSLLAVGIKKIYGQFETGEIIEIINEKKESIAFGLVQQSSDHVNPLLGSLSARGIELVHTDNLIVIA